MSTRKGNYTTFSLPTSPRLKSEKNARSGKNLLRDKNKKIKAITEIRKK